MLDERDVGHRVVVRRRLGTGPHGRPILTDLLGELIRLDQDRLVVRRDDGTEQSVAREIVVAAKRVPPRPARFAEIVALERVADAAWPAPVHERLGDWFLRAAAGWTARANSALPLGEAGLPLDQAVGACVAWYRERGLRPCITVPLPLRRDLRDVLVAQGWYADPLVLVQTARLADVLEPSAVALEPRQRLELGQRPSEDFLRLIQRRKGPMPEAGRHVLTAPATVRFAEIRESATGDGATLLAVARGAVVDGWLHLALVEVVPAARRRGLAGLVSQALARWAAEAGAVRALLQVEERNAAASSRYARMGFHTHHRYVTFRDPTPDPADHELEVMINC